MAARPSADRFELWISVAVLLSVMVLVMWAQRPRASCAMPPEAARRLVLTRDVDREHLARDQSEADRIARRVGALGPDAGFEGRFEACEATLVRQIMTAHGLTAAQTRRSPA